MTGGESEEARELSYRGRTIELASYQVLPSGWAPRALVVTDSGDSVHHQPLGAADNRTFQTRVEADDYALKLARAWIDERG